MIFFQFNTSADTFKSVFPGWIQSALSLHPRANKIQIQVLPSHCNEQLFEETHHYLSWWFRNLSSYWRSFWHVNQLSCKLGSTLQWSKQEHKGTYWLIDICWGLEAQWTVWLSRILISSLLSSYIYIWGYKRNDLSKSESQMSSHLWSHFMFCRVIFKFRNRKDKQKIMST